MNRINTLAGMVIFCLLAAESPAEIDKSKVKEHHRWFFDNSVDMRPGVATILWGTNTPRDINIAQTELNELLSSSQAWNSIQSQRVIAIINQILGAIETELYGRRISESAVDNEDVLNAIIRIGDVLFGFTS